jgi:outer membrane protein assembly factor BamB
MPLARELIHVRIALEFLVGFYLACTVHHPSAMGDWPQILGANRDSIAANNTELPDTLNAPLKTLWTLDAGQGYAGASIADQKTCLMDRASNADRIRLVDLTTGQIAWTREFPTNFNGGIDADKGPRCVPTLYKDQVLLYTAAGTVHCLAASDGRSVWSRDLRKEYGADDGYFGAGSTPIVIRDRMVINTGGKKGGIVCLKLEDGKTLWTSTQAEASYASPIHLAPPLDQQVLVPTRLTTYGVDLQTGEQLWSVPFGQRGPTVNAATPLQLGGNMILLTASYGVGSLCISPQANKVDTIHKGDLLSSQYASPVLIDGSVYGSDGREDYANGSYKCLSPSGGKVYWEQSDMPICHSIVVGNKLLVIGVDGKVWCVKPNRERFEALWMTQLPSGTYRALPAMDIGTLVVRSSDRWLALKVGK